MENIISNYIIFLTKLKLYHWKTSSYARHIASDSLHTNLHTLLDKFVETYQGSYGKLNFDNHNFNITSTIVKDDETIIKSLIHMRNNLSNELIKYIEKNTDLCNIKDDMITEINKTIYLFSLQ